ncbi:YidH family protein [Pontivivens insulae]|nr:DUF202 domain-containing protein [Pontivivens insulae]
MSDKNELAKDRTDWAEDRTVMANERTFAGWMRTGMSSLAIAIGLSAVFKEAEPTWVPKAFAMVFVICALLIFEAARRASCKVTERLEAHAAEPQDTRAMTAVAILLMIGSVAVGAILWFL